MRRLWVVLLGMMLIVAALGCGSKPPETATENSPAPGQQAAPGTTASKGPAAKSPGIIERLTTRTITVPEGTVLHVRMNETVSSKSSSAGETFTATVEEPVVIGEDVVVPKGADASGTVVDAQPLGKFKGAAKLHIRLDSVAFGGKSYNIDTTSVVRSAKGKGKRSAVMIGGGAGLGALIGGLAGGGKGAAIGALVGAGAGTGGAYFTGNKDIVIPAETALSFKLLKAITVTK